MIRGARRGACLVAGLVGLAGCTERVADVAAPPTPALFVDAAGDTGLDFRHDAGLSEERFLAEIVGAGAAWIDVDGDGDLDAYLVQVGGRVDAQPAGLTNRLFRNELVPSGRLAFVDVTDEAGVGDGAYGMGVATGDYDNDGDVDMYLTNVGSNVLYRNEGDGRFVDVTKTAGVDDPRFSMSATFTDLDGDGYLDLFVTNYVDDSVAGNKVCTSLADTREYCSPTAYPAAPDSLFRNLGDGSFADMSVAGGIAAAAGAGLGVVAADFDADGRTDVFVANDQSANFLWLNRGGWRFDEAGLESGSAYNGHGMAEASMGVTVGDYDADGDEDLFMTHLGTQTNTLYRNDGHGYFSDVTDRAGLGAGSLPFTGFGTRWFDYDHDGHLDLFVANGAIVTVPSRVGRSPLPYEERNQLFRGVGGGRYTEIRDAVLDTLHVSRGAAFGDVDNDGDVDILVTNANGPAELMLNQHDSADDWLILSLIDRRGRHAYGARVAILRAGRDPLWRRVQSDGSYLSANDARVHVGLGPASGPVDAGVVWPSGGRELYLALAPGRIVTLHQGDGADWPVGAPDAEPVLP